MATRRPRVRKVSVEHGDAIRIVPLHPGSGAEIVAPAAAPKLTYRNGPLIVSVEVFTVFWGATWNSAPQDAIMAEMNQFFDFIVTSALIDQLGEYNVPGYVIAHGKRTGATTIASPALHKSVTDSAIQKMLQNEIATNTAFP